MIKITLELPEEMDLGWANGWGRLEDTIYEALMNYAKEKGVSRTEMNIGRCCTLYKYPGVFKFRVDSTD